MGTTAALILSAAQLHWANVSYTIGSEQNDGYTLAALVWQESSFCERKRNHWSVGCAGTKRSTVRAIFDPGATRARLESENEYSIRAGLSILDYCRRNTASWRRAVSCYHLGLPMESKMSDEQINKDSYVLSIIDKVNKLKALPIDTR